MSLSLGNYEISYDDDDWDADDWASRHPADEPDADDMQPIVVLEKIVVEQPRAPGVPGRRPGNDPTIRPYRCEQCPGRFTSNSSLQVHMRRHTGEKPFVCAFCPRRFRHRSAWTDHERQHEEANVLPFACDVCGWRCRMKKTLVSHMRDNHQCSRPLQCTAQNCLSLFVHRASLELHEEQQHGILPPPGSPPETVEAPLARAQSGLPRYDCTVCGKQFSSTNALHAHKRFHMSKNRRRCRQCPMHFSSELSLRSHMRVHYKGKVPVQASLKCKLCAARFSSRSLLFAHLKMHDRQQGGNLYYRCSKCFERFAGRKKLWAHLKTHREDSKEEPLSEESMVADATSPVGEELCLPADPDAAEPVAGPSHMPHQPPKSKAKKYQCPTCSRVFEKYNSLYYHRTTACPGGPRGPGLGVGVKARPHLKGFTCSRCGMRFKTKKQIGRHVHTHAIKVEADASDEPGQPPLGENQTDEQHDTEPSSGHSPGGAAGSAGPTKSFRCGKCSEPFPDRRALHVHSKIHAGAMVVLGVDSDAVPDLPGGSMDDSTASAASKSDVPGPSRVKRARTAPSPSYRCTECGQAFTNRKKFARHCNSSQCPAWAGSGEQRGKGYRCRKCNELFPDKKSQMVHHEKMHSNMLEHGIKEEPGTQTKKLRCLKCPQIFVDVKSHWLHYKEHLVEMLQDEMYEIVGMDVASPPAYKCRKCDEVFPDKISHWWHYRTHMNSEETEGTYVEARSASSDPLLDPLAKHFRCTKCPEIFPDDDAHWLHFREHMPFVQFEEREAPDPQLTCSECGAVSPDEDGHWMHFKTHATIPIHAKFDLTPAIAEYRCRKCSEVFPDQESHWWHFRSHSSIDMDLCDPMAESDEADPLAIRTLHCSKCPEVFADERTHWWHSRSHIENLLDCVEVVGGEAAVIPEYRCAKCPEVFSSEEAHWLHYRAHYVAEGGLLHIVANGQVNGHRGKLRCGLCPELFDDEGGAWAHFRTHCDGPVCKEVDSSESGDGDPGPATFRCVKCSEESSSAESHWWHYRCHVPEDADVEPVEVPAAAQSEPRSVRCLRCGEAFGDADAHWDHYRVHVDEEVCEEVDDEAKAKMYPCAECDAVFPDRRSRFLHGAVHVTPRNQAAAGQQAKAATAAPAGYGFQCNKCREIFLDTESHWWHYKTVHDPVAVSVGPDTYEVVELTDNPAEDDSLTKRCQCTKCPETFVDRRALNAHSRAVHGASGADASDAQPSSGRSLRCSKCTELFPDRKSLWWHYRTHMSSLKSTATELPSREADGEHSDQGQSLRCGKCPETLADRESLLAHHRAVHGEDLPEEEPTKRDFLCSQCPEVFADLESHWWHYRVHSDSEFIASLEEESKPAAMKYHCSKCSECFPDRRSHYIHFKQVHKRPSQPADDVESQQARQDPPLGSESDPQPQEDEPASPAEEEEDSQTQKNQAPPQGAAGASCQSQKSQGKGFKCKHCPSVLPSAKKLERHESHHRRIGPDGPKPFKCTVCNRYFHMKLNLFNHMKSHVMNGAESEPPAMSSAPSTSAKTGKTEKTSKTAPSGSDSASVRRFQCSKCPARFSTRPVLWAHHKTHRTADRMYPCTECGAKFNARGHLRAHAEIHQSQKVSQGHGTDGDVNAEGAAVAQPSSSLFPCSKCDAVFTRDVSLRAHKRVHIPANAKPFKCKQCSARFTLGFNLKRHVRAHHRAAIHKCPHCQLHFSSANEKNEHVRSVHAADAQAVPSSSNADQPC